MFLLICGEIDLSAGFVYTFAPFLMHYLIDFYGVPVVPAIIISLLFGVVVGWVNGFLTVTMGLPSFITTLGTGFILLGLTLTTSHAYPANIPATAVGIGRWIGAAPWSQFIWAIALTAIFYVVLNRTKWGLHTIATGGNRWVPARPASRPAGSSTATSCSAQPWARWSACRTPSTPTPSTRAPAATSRCSTR